MNHGDLAVVKAEGLAVDQAFDDSQLVEHDKVSVLNLEVDGVKIILDQLILQMIHASLAQV